MSDEYEFSKYYPEKVLTKREIAKLNRIDKRRLMGQLSIMKCMTSEDIAETIGCSKQYVDSELSVAAKEGVPTRTVIGLSGKELALWKERQTPDHVEWLWRFAHQSKEYLASRFGPILPSLIRRAGMMSYAPEWIAATEDEKKRHLSEVPDLRIITRDGEEVDVKQMVIPATPRNPERNVVIIGTDVEIHCYNKVEQSMVNGIVNMIDAQYDMRSPGSWRTALPAIEIYRDYYRHCAGLSNDEAARDPVVLKARQQIYKEMLDAFKSLPIEKKSTPGDFELFERARERAVEYWAEFAYKHAVSCRVCGQIEYTYLPFYQSLIRAKLAIDEIKDADIPDAEKWQRLLIAWDANNRNPHFDIQLRDLGIAWSQDLIEWGQELMKPVKGQVRRPLKHDRAKDMFEEKRLGGACEVVSVSSDNVVVRWFGEKGTKTYPYHDFFEFTSGPISWDQISDGIAAQLGIGPDCLNDVIPASPLNRVKRIGLDEFEVSHVE